MGAIRGQVNIQVILLVLVICGWLAALLYFGNILACPLPPPLSTAVLPTDGAARSA